MPQPRLANDLSPRAARLHHWLTSQCGRNYGPSDYGRLEGLAEQRISPGTRAFVGVFNGQPQGSWELLVEGRSERLIIFWHARQRWSRHGKAVQGGWQFDLGVVAAVADQLDLAGNPYLADSVRVAFLCSEQHVEAADGTVLQQIAGALKLEALPSGLKERITNLRLPVPQGRHLLEFQRIGASYLVLSAMRAYLGDAPGAGKTIEILAALSATHQRSMPVLVVAPRSATANWADEVRTWAPWFEPTVIHGRGKDIPTKLPTRRSIWITSYGMLAKMLPGLLRTSIRTIVIDEAQYVKNPETARAKAVRALAHHYPNAIMASGTAVENDVDELWHQLHCLRPKEFPSLEHFKELVSALEHREIQVLDNEGRVVRRVLRAPSHMLGGMLSRIMVRRTKQQVLSQLPPKTREFLDVDLPDDLMRAYKTVENDARQFLQREWRSASIRWAVQRYVQLWRLGNPPARAAELAVYEANRRVPALANGQKRMQVLRRFLGEAKVPLALQWLAEQRVEDDSPIVVFCMHRRVARALVEGVEGTKVLIDGQVSGTDRSAAVRRFQQGKIGTMVATLALHTAVTLTRAHRELFVERFWVPAKEEQAEDRVHRITQQHPVRITYLQARNTVDEHVERLTAAKRLMTDTLLGGEATTVIRNEAVLEGEVTRSFAGGVARAILERPPAIGIQDLRRALHALKTKAR